MIERGCSSIPGRLCLRVSVVVAATLIPVIAAAQDSQRSGLNLNGPGVLGLRSDLPADVRRITLADAQQLAQAASDPLVRLGQLQVEAARQHRRGVTSMYFPSVATQFLN